MTLAISAHEQELVEKGYTLLEGIVTNEEAEAALQEFGVLIPQYNGQLRYEVQADVGYDARKLSKSINTVPWHIDAPSWDPPPVRMALHCRTQAKCGSGHTELADMRAFIAGLNDEDRGVMYERELPWIDRNSRTGVSRPMVERLPGGREIIRYRHSLLTGGANNRLLGEKNAQRPLGEIGLHIAELTEKFFDEQAMAFLIPENAILVWDNIRLVHRRRAYQDPSRHLTRYWFADR